MAWLPFQKYLLGRIGGHIGQVSRRHVVHLGQDVVFRVEAEVGLVSIEPVQVVTVQTNVFLRVRVSALKYQYSGDLKSDQLNAKTFEIWTF